MVNPRSDSVAVFIHIPKTAGTTLHQVIESQYNPKNTVSIHTRLENIEQINKFKNYSVDKKQGFRVIKGHTFFGWHQILSKPCAYFTLLRDPVERFVSNYYFLLKKKDHPVGQKLLKQKVSLEEFCQLPGEDNYQTRYLAKNVMDPDLDLQRNECSGQMLDLAKKNLAENFAVVGTVEEFDKTLLILKNTFGWKNIYYKVKNQNKQRPKKDSIPIETLKLIEDKNKFDLELYHFASEILQSLIKNQSNSFEKEVEDFQNFMNSPLGQVSALISSSASKVKRIITLD